MVQMNYLGVTDPRREFAALRPAYERLRAMMIRCRPMGPDYVILLRALSALGEAAQHFTEDPYVFGGSAKASPSE